LDFQLSQGSVNILQVRRKYLWCIQRIFVRIN